jgi:hypothetical protein
VWVDRCVPRPRVCRQGHVDLANGLAGRITGSRNVIDFSVTDVLIELADPGPLLVCMKVDLYFHHATVSQ